MRTLYFDNNATTQVSDEVIARITEVLPLYYNPSSHYKEAHNVNDLLKKSRIVLSQFLGTEKKSEIIFTGSATEANNIAIKGALLGNKKRNEIITTKVEHPSIKAQCDDLELQGYKVTYLSVDRNGDLNIDELIDALSEKTAIVSIMHANNETGVIFPIEKLSRIVKQSDPDILFHTDATQTVGKLPINMMQNLKYVDLLSFSGHKLHAPKGIGVLYARKGTKFRPLIVGGHQEKGRRAGTENIPYICGLATAIELASKNISESAEMLSSFQQDFETFLKSEIKNIRINGESTKRLVNTTSVSFQGIEGESILYALNEQGVCASTGSACSSGSLTGSHVLQAMSIPFDYAHGTIRFSFGKYNTKAELEELKRLLPTVIEKLRKISPFA